MSLSVNFAIGSMVAYDHMKHVDIFIKDGVMHIPSKNGGVIRWPVDMIRQAGFDYWWKNVPNRGLDESDYARTWKVYNQET